MAGDANRHYIVLPVPDTKNRTTRVLVQPKHEARTDDSQIGLIVAANARGDSFSDTTVT